MPPVRTTYVLVSLLLVLPFGAAAAQDGADSDATLQADVERLQGRVEALEQENARHAALLALRFLEAAGLHAIDASLEAGEVDPRFTETVATSLAALGTLTWSEPLQEPANAFLEAARSLHAALQDGDESAAADAAALAHDRQHALTHAIVAWAGPPADGEEAAGDHGSNGGGADAGAADAVPEGVQRFEIEIGEDGGAIGGAATHRVDAGDTVAFVIHSQVGGELHLHGLEGDWVLTPGEPAIATVEASATGRFPMEIHPEGTERGVTVAYLEVHP